MLPIDIIASHDVAVWILGLINRLLDMVGLSHHQLLQEIVYIIIIAVISIFIGWAVKTIILLTLRKIVQIRKGELGRELLEQKVFLHCSHIIPPLVFLGLVPFAFNSDTKFLIILERLVGIYAIIAFGIGLCSVVSFGFYRFDKKENTRNLPIKGILNVTQGIIWIIISIVSVSIIIDKSPAALLAGLGAFAAALLLIFKSSILGFVAGIQMSQNDMLHVGDWIMVPGTPANGIVLDVSLTRVKIQNFDNTIINVPPYTLVSTSFQNYRGMKDSGARRICQNILFDSATVKSCTPDYLERVSTKYPILKDFITKAQAAPDNEIDDPGMRPINGTIKTNLGLYRAYLSQVIFNSKKFANNQQLLINIVGEAAAGITMQIYCFTATTDWDQYEAIQSDLMEHVAVTVNDFDLALYNAGSVTVSGQLSAPKGA